MSAWSRLTAPLRRARWKAARWSTDSDRAFHDALFAAGQYDPFTFSYPGYLTIRRFADLAEQKLRGVRRVLDLGCGPGEITCELARRQPGMRFTGVDHSSAAAERRRAWRQPPRRAADQVSRRRGHLHAGRRDGARRRDVVQRSGRCAAADSVQSTSAMRRRCRR